MEINFLLGQVWQIQRKIWEKESTPNIGQCFPTKVHNFGEFLLSELLTWDI